MKKHGKWANGLSTKGWETRLVLVFFVVFTSCPATAQQDKFSELNRKFEEAKVRIELPLTELNTAYQKRLMEMGDKAQVDGDLNKVLAITRELKQFSQKKRRSLTPIPICNGPSPLT